MEGFNVLLKEEENLISFYKQRLELEASFSKGLSDLVLKQEEIERRDGEQRRQNQTWKEVKASTIQQSKIHKNSCETIQVIVNKLINSRNNRERSWKNIKENLRSAKDEHLGYLATTSRLKRNYESKVEEVIQEAEKEFEKDNGAASEGSDLGHERRNSSSSSRGGESTSQTFVSGATSSTSSAQSAYLDPPKPNVFDAITSISKSDWSGEKKHRVNSIVRAVGQLASRAETAASSISSGGIGRSNSVKGRSSHNNNGSSSKKREAELADNAYRSAVFRLETLRLQRERVQNSALESLKEFTFESSSLLKDIFEKQSISLETLGQSLIAVGEHIKHSVNLIDPKNDSIQFIKQFPSPPAQEKVHYHNVFVGECRVIFGVSLTDYVGMNKDKDRGQLVPRVVRRCISEIDERGLEVEGIYRISGKLSTVQQLVQRIEKDEENFKFESQDDPAIVASVLKLYLRQLPFPLFNFPTAEIEFSKGCEVDPEQSLISLTRRIGRLPAAHQATLKLLVEHLSRVVEHESINKMGLLGLGIVFSAVVFGEDESATLESMKKASKDIVMQLLIQHHSTLFGNLQLEQSARRLRSESLSNSTTQLTIPNYSSQPTSSSESPALPAISLTDFSTAEQSRTVEEATSPLDSLYELYQDSLAATSSPIQPSVPAPLPFS